MLSFMLLHSRLLFAQHHFSFTGEKVSLHISQKCYNALFFHHLYPSFKAKWIYYKVIFERGSHYVTPGILELVMWAMLTSDSQISTHLFLLSARIKGVGYHI